MKKLNRSNTKLEEKKPTVIVQFGEGNFLRAFVDYAFEKLNDKADFNAGIAVVQPIENGLTDLLNEQDGLYTLFMNGFEKGKEIQEKILISNIVASINPYKDFSAYLDLAKAPTLQFIFSNTTEAGIAYDASDKFDDQPPGSFPAKLTVLLYERFKHFNGDQSKGLSIIPCELINYNADTLQSVILKYIDLWQLDSAFKSWIINHNAFHNTLVDRIVPGYPKGQIENYNRQLDYEDKLIVTAETFFLWVIEGDDALKAKLPFHLTDLDVKMVKDMQPFRTRKVRILNGAHTSMVPISLLYGNSTVKEAIQDEFTGNFVSELVFNEIINTLEMDKNELKSFADAVFDRFRNPFIKHQLSSIALNSISKFKVRVLPSLVEFEQKFGYLPIHLTFAFACLIRFYKGEWEGNELPVNDDQQIMDDLRKIWESNDLNNITREVLGNISYWDRDLNQINGLTELVVKALESIEALGIKNGFNEFKSNTTTIKSSL